MLSCPSLKSMLCQESARPFWNVWEGSRKPNNWDMLRWKGGAREEKAFLHWSSHACLLVFKGFDTIALTPIHYNARRSYWYKDSFCAAYNGLFVFGKISTFAIYTAHSYIVFRSSLYCLSRIQPSQHPVAAAYCVCNILWFRRVACCTYTERMFAISSSCMNVCKLSANEARRRAFL